MAANIAFYLLLHLINALRNRKAMRKYTNEYLPYILAIVEKLLSQISQTVLSLVCVCVGGE